MITLKRTYLALLSVVTLVAVGGFLASSSLAQQKGVNIPNGYNRGTCSGSHCTFIATWATDLDREQVELLETLITTDTLALGFAVKNEAGQTTTDLTPGESFTIPVEASGEIVGHAGHFYDTPPVYFETNGRLRAVTQGLGECNFSSSIVIKRRECREVSLAGRDIIGKWTDAWKATTASGTPISGVTCTTNAAGTLAQCTSTETINGQVRLELTRTVDDLRWEGIPVLGEVLVEGVNGDPGDPFPGSMKSSVTVNFASAPTTTPPEVPSTTPECSDGLDNDNDDLIDCDDFGCLADVEDPNSCVPDDDDETDTPGFIPGPFQEQD